METMLITAVFLISVLISANVQPSTCMEYGGGFWVPFLLRTPGFKASVWTLVRRLAEIGSAMDMRSVYGFASFMASPTLFIQRCCAHCWRATATDLKFEGDQQLPKFCRYRIQEQHVLWR